MSQYCDIQRITVETEKTLILVIKKKHLSHIEALNDAIKALKVNLKAEMGDSVQ